MKQAGGARAGVDWSRRRTLLWAVAAVLAGALLRLAFVLYLNRTPNDTLLYADIAQNWFQHGVYGFTSIVNGHAALPRPTLIRLPGYPAFLGVLFSLFGWGNYRAVLLVQATVDLGTCGLVAGMTARLFGRKAWLPALWLGVLCPFLANYSAVPLTETLTVFTVAAAFYGLLRWRQAGAGRNGWVLAIGAALAYSLLLRPDQGLLAAAAVPAMVWIGFVRAGRRLKLNALMPAVGASLLVLLPLVPWTIRNERTFHVFQPLSPKSATDPGGFVPTGFQRWYRTWGVEYATTETAYWPYDSDEIHVTDLPDRAFDTPAQRAATAAVLADYNLNTTATPALDVRFNAIAMERIAASPVRYYVLLPVARVLNMAFRPRTSFLPLPVVWWKRSPKPWQNVLAGGLAALNLGYFSLALLGWTGRHRLALQYEAAAPILWSMAASIALRSAMLLTIDNSEPRYTLEFYPLLIMLGAAWLSRATYKVRP